MQLKIFFSLAWRSAKSQMFSADKPPPQKHFCLRERVGQEEWVAQLSW
jgi:hypothetical protein